MRSAGSLALALVFTCLVASCGGTPVENDASLDAAQPDAPLLLCLTDADCDDGLFCSGTEQCTAGRCHRTPAACDDGLTCTRDRCSEEQRACIHTPPDVDGDGFADAACVDSGSVPLGTDCDDHDALRSPGGHEICDASHDEDCDPATLGGIDDDADGYVSAACCNGTTCGPDCDDARPASHPGATEICDGLDQNCDGIADDGVTAPGFRDADGDGWGDASHPLAACVGAANWADASHGGDCADDPTANPDARAINPGQPEICDGIRNDCSTTLAADVGAGVVNWYHDLDGDGFGAASSGVTSSCTPVPMASLLGTDCDDMNAARNPAAAEVCNGIDDDCNGRKDYRIGPNDYEDDDDDGLVDSACVPLGTDCNDTDPFSGPGEAERCDGRDNDCDGMIDEGATSVVYYRDVDGDGWGSPASGTIIACMTMAGYQPLAGDCNDMDPNRHPAAIDLCNGADDDCDAAVDEAPASSLCAAVNATAAACVSGRCESTTCAANFGDCNGHATDGCETVLTNDVTHCGNCATVCGPGESCTAGHCVSGCSAGLVYCASTCIDPRYDERYCGATAPCNTATHGAMCAVDQVCAASTCASSFILPGGDLASAVMPRIVSYRIDTAGTASIYYTLDGSTPGASPTTMSGPAPLSVSLGTGVTVRWYPQFAGGATGPIQSYTHTTAPAQNDLGVVGEGLNMNGAGPVISVTAGTIISATVNAQAWKSNASGYCPGCVVYSQIVFSGSVASCLGNISAGYPGQTFAGRAFSITAPPTPGAYPVYLSVTQDYSCTPRSGQIIGWVFVR